MHTIPYYDPQPLLLTNGIDEIKPQSMEAHCDHLVSVFPLTRRGRENAETRKRRKNDQINCFSRFRAHIDLIQLKLTQKRGNVDTDY